MYEIRHVKVMVMEFASYQMKRANNFVFLDVYFLVSIYYPTFDTKKALNENVLIAYTMSCSWPYFTDNDSFG